MKHFVCGLDGSLELKCLEALCLEKKGMLYTTQSLECILLLTKVNLQTFFTLNPGAFRNKYRNKKNDEDSPPETRGEEVTIFYIMVT